MSDLESRVEAIERALRRKGIHIPEPLTDEERAGAPVHPYRRENLQPFFTLNPAAQKYELEQYKKDIAKWRQRRSASSE